MTEFYIYFGRLHPLLVHLPIGLIIGALLLDGWRMMKPASGSDASLSVIWTAAALSAILSAMTGYVHANGDGYAEEILSLHRIGGISLAVITTMIAAAYVFNSSLIRRRLIRIPLLSFIFGLMVYTGHGGGSLTHGADYLNFSAASEVEPSTTVRRTSIDAVELFNDAVIPILQTKCVSCHNATKRKGDLLLVSHASIMKGGKSGPGVISGDPTASELFRRVSLPSDHKEFMPTEGRMPLTENQRAILEWWIAKGAAASMPVAKHTPDARMKELLEEYFQIHRDAMLDMVSEPVSEDDLEDLRAAGFRVNRISAAGSWLDIKYEDSTRPDLDVLRRVRDQLVWLQVSDCGLTDEDMSSIAELNNLVRLNISQNAIGDAGVSKLQGLNQLEYLNLYSTRISKSSLNLFSSGFPKLKKLYVWDTVIDTIQPGVRKGLDIIYRLD
jgi:uncharacterized membrane protein